MWRQNCMKLLKKNVNIIRFERIFTCVHGVWTRKGQQANLSCFMDLLACAYGFILHERKWKCDQFLNELRTCENRYWKFIETNVTKCSQHKSAQFDKIKSLRCSFTSHCSVPWFFVAPVCHVVEFRRHWFHEAIASWNQNLRKK